MHPFKKDLRSLTLTASWRWNVVTQKIIKQTLRPNRCLWHFLARTHLLVCRTIDEINNKLIDNKLADIWRSYILNCILSLSFFFFFLNSGYDFSSFSLCNMRGGSVSGMRRISLSQLALDNVGRWPPYLFATVIDFYTGVSSVSSVTPIQADRGRMKNVVWGELLAPPCHIIAWHTQPFTTFYVVHLCYTGVLAL